MDSDHVLFERMTDGDRTRSTLSSLASVPIYYLDFCEDAGFSLDMTKTILYALFCIKSDVEYSLEERVQYWKYTKPQHIATEDNSAKYNFILFVAYTLYMIQMFIKLDKGVCRKSIEVDENIYAPILAWLRKIDDIHDFTTKLFFIEAEDIHLKLQELWVERSNYGTVDQRSILDTITAIEGRLKVPHNLTRQDQQKGGKNSSPMAKHPALMTKILDSYENHTDYHIQRQAAKMALRDYETDMKDKGLKWSIDSVIRHAKKRKNRQK